jgi:hypothetical protein
MGSATRLRRGYVVPGIEGKVARVATRESGNERISIREDFLDQRRDVLKPGFDRLFPFHKRI